MIEFVSLVIRNSKLEFLHKISLLVVDSAAEMVVMEDIPPVPGTISREPVLSQDGYMMIANGVNHITSHHVIIMLMEDMKNVMELNPLLNVHINVHLAMKNNMLTINGMLILFIQYHLMFKRFRHKL